MTSDRPQLIEIPLKDSAEVVEVFLEELPDDASEICGIIIDEQAPPDLFLQFATEYYYRKRLDGFKAVVERGMSECRRRSGSEAVRAYVALCSAMAAHHISQGIREIDRKKASALLDEATMLLNDAERKDSMADALWLRRGLLLLAKRSLDPAEYQFKIVLAKDVDSVAAHLGLGCVAFCAGNYRTALAEFQGILRKLPSGPSGIRLVIGFCLYKLGLYAEAQRSFERVLQLKPDDIDALAALSILHLNRASQEPQSLSKGMNMLKKAYELNRHHPLTLNHLANHFFFKKDYAKAQALANAALAATDIDAIRGDSHFFLGKIHHIQEKYDEAYSNYIQAVKLNPELILAQYGLGQLYLQRGDLQSATGCFERVLTFTPANPDVVQILGLLYLQSAEAQVYAKAEDFIRRALSQTPTGSLNAFDLWIALASVLETRSPQDALDAYAKARAIDHNRIDSEVELLNNIGVMYHSTGHLVLAQEYLNKAIDICEPIKNDSSDSYHRELFHVILFNYGRLLEDQSLAQEAEEVYKAILTEQPSFLDCHLRLGMIALRRGQVSDATDHFKEAIGHDENQVDAWTLLAASHYRVKAITPSRKAFERVLSRNDRHDQYSLVSLGNIYIEIARHEKKAASVGENFRRAVEFFNKAIQLETGNAYAAHGLAVVLAEKGHYKEAKDVFLQVRQALPDFFDVWVNLGHCFVELGQYQAAINAYEHVLPKTESSKKVAIILFVARAQYLQGKHEKQLSFLEQAIVNLQSASALLPHDQPIKFNIALCQQELASALLKRGQIPCTDEELAKAMEALDEAHSTFSRLASAEKTTNGQPSLLLLNCDPTVIQQRAKYCQSLRQTLSNRMSQIHQDERERLTRLEQFKLQREAQERVQQEKEVEAKRAWQEEQSRIEATRREMAARLKVVDERIKAANEVVSDGEGDVEGEGEGEDESESESESSAPSKKWEYEEASDSEKRTRKRHNKITKTSKRGRAKRTLAADAEPETGGHEEDEEMPMHRRRSGGKPSLSKEFISSEDEAEAPADETMLAALDQPHGAEM